MQQDIRELLEKANRAKYLYHLGKITREQAEQEIRPYLELAKIRGNEIAKKYGKKFHGIPLIKFLR